jgi:MFS family permease
MRRLLFLVSSIIFVDAMLFTALSPLVPRYADEFDLSKIGAGLLVGAFGAGALLGGVPGGLAAAKFGPKRAVVGGLVLLGVASFAFAAADGALALGAARFVQGFSSTTTWAGALAWLAVAAPRAQRGRVIGTAFGAAVFGAVLGPMFGGLAEVVGIRASFATVGTMAFVFAALASLPRSAPSEPLSVGGARRALRDTRFLGGLWLNTSRLMKYAQAHRKIVTENMTRKVMQTIVAEKTATAVSAMPANGNPAAPMPKRTPGAVSAQTTQALTPESVPGGEMGMNQ